MHFRLYDRDQVLPKRNCLVILTVMIDTIIKFKEVASTFDNRCISGLFNNFLQSLPQGNWELHRFNRNLVTKYHSLCFEKCSLKICSIFNGSNQIDFLVLQKRSSKDHL